MTLLFTLLLLCLGLGTPARAACETPLPVEAVGGVLDEAEAAYRALDLERFRTAMDRAALTMDCLAVPADTSLAGRYHRLQGLRAFVLRDEERAKQAFLAARLADPEYVLPEDLVPAAHPVRRSYGALPLDSAGVEELPVPTRGSLRLDGVTTLLRPARAPTLFQYIGEDGQAVSTAYLWPGVAPPAYPHRAPATGGSGGGGNTALWVASGSCALLGAGLYGAGLYTHDRYWDRATPVAETDRLRGLTHGLGGAAIGLGTTAVVLGVVALLKEDG